jgi:hypothetical protein
MIAVGAVDATLELVQLLDNARHVSCEYSSLLISTTTATTTATASASSFAAAGTAVLLGSEAHLLLPSFQAAGTPHFRAAENESSSVQDVNSLGH